jgi:hypothetical protein
MALLVREWIVQAIHGEDVLTWNRSEEEAKDADRAKLLQSARLPLGSLPIVFLGIDDRPTASDGSVPAAVDPSNPKGVPYFALDAGDEDWTFEGGEFGDARNNASNMDGWSAGIFAQARALIDWNGRNKVSNILSRMYVGAYAVLVLSGMWKQAVLAVGGMEEELCYRSRAYTRKTGLFLDTGPTQLRIPANGSSKY